jgi:hypothetical protein
MKMIIFSNEILLKYDDKNIINISIFCLYCKIIRIMIEKIRYFQNINNKQAKKKIKLNSNSRQKSNQNKKKKTTRQRSIR